MKPEIKIGLALLDEIEKQYQLTSAEKVLFAKIYGGELFNIVKVWLKTISN